MNGCDIYLGGSWIPARGSDVIPIINPSTEQCIATVPECSTEDVDAAVHAAMRACSTLRALSLEERVDILLRLASELERRSADFADTISMEMGMPRRLCEHYQVTPAIEILRATAAALYEVTFKRHVDHTLIRREPAGVVAIITSWSYPLIQIVSKLGPALAAGCPVVLKPSELAPLDAYLLCEAADTANLPAGTLNMVTGTGQHVGESLTRHHAVRVISLAGSTRAGKRVAQVAASSSKRVVLELSGKSSAILLDDADLAIAVQQTVHSVLINSGQANAAYSRMLVPYELLPIIEELLADAMGNYRVGPAHDLDSDVGPQANALQLQRVREHIARAAVNGARTVWAYPSDDLPSKGFFVPPTVLAAPDPATDAAGSHVLGPVLKVVPYLDESDAVALARAIGHGLATCVWSADEERALRLAESLDSSLVHINCAPICARTPPQRHTMSGGPQEVSRHSIEEFTDLRLVQIGSMP